MKKTFFGLSIVLMSLILTSCLGDTSSTFEGSGLFTVISRFEDTGNKYVPTRQGAITWDNIDRYNVGDAVIINYKVDLNNVIGGAYNAEYVLVTDSLPNSGQKTIIESAPIVSANPFKALALTTFYPTEVVLDRWLLSYAIDIKEGQGSELSFYYDANNQNPEEVTAIPAEDKPCIIDVVLNITGQPANSNTETKNKNIVVKMGNIREILKPTTSDKETKRDIWFRFKKTDAVKPDFVKGGYLIYPSQLAN